MTLFFCEKDEMDMDTKIIKINSTEPEEELIQAAAALIRDGELVAFPTETVYGLGADGINEDAVKKIFQSKGRPQDNPLILHVDSVDMLEQLVIDIPPAARLCIKKFWPGPLTILFRRREIVPDIITAGLETVAIRMPSHPIALRLISLSGTPIAAPSANSSGKPSPTRAEHVLEDMDGKIPMIIDGGETGVGLESTVLDLTGDKPMILRPGGVTLEDVRMLLPNAVTDPALGSSNKDMVPKSPGQKYRHYAPKAQMILVSGENKKIVDEINRLTSEAEVKGMKVGIMCCTENKGSYTAQRVADMGSCEDKETIAHNLFHIIRDLDRSKVDLIICEAVGEDEIGLAIMNRLLKAAGGKLVKV